MVTMSQKSSLLQPANSVSQVLIPDKIEIGCPTVQQLTLELVDAARDEKQEEERQ
jgi:hypothetical protein